MTSPHRLSLSQRLIAGVAAAVLAPMGLVLSLEACGVLTEGALPIAAGVAAGVATLAAAMAAWSAVRPLNGLSREMGAVSQSFVKHETFSRAQNSLDQNLALLREALFALGEPRQVGGDLYFGSHLVNGDFAAVDHVRAAAGGTATIFLGDLRISTNVMRPDGGRAVGTRLAAGPVRDAVLGEGRGYRGEAEILGEAYFAIYEPLVSNGEVIGVLYVGVKKADFEHGMDPAAKRTGDVVQDMGVAVADFHAAASSAAEAEAEAIRRRQLSEDVRRQQERARQIAVREQREVVEQLSAALERLAAGDFSTGVEAAFPSEYAKLRDDFNNAFAALRKAMTHVRTGCSALRQGSEEIRLAADDLAGRTERQAATLEQTAAALDQITTTVKRTAEGADRAGRLVSNARGAAERSGDVMRQAVSAMDRIQASSQQIAQIIGVIDEIAFQTNLLALNAGVEAARAGDSGRGFAVVASEVRTLAQRSATAAREIKTLIATSGEEVTAGAQVVSQTGEALSQIVGHVVDVDRLVVEIATSAREEARALAQVNTAVNEMDRVTQQNAAMVEQSTAASHALAREADSLTRTVSAFRLGAKDAPATPALARLRPAA